MVKRHTKSNSKLLSRISVINDWRSVFDWSSDVSVGGIYMVELNGKTSHYNPRKNCFISDYWFDDAHNFDRFGRWPGCAIVKDGGRYNVICKDGTLLFRHWYDYIGYLNDGVFFLSDGVSRFEYDLLSGKRSRID